ncbi:MAG TPA: ABC transporter permease [Bryobacteraceae bacterium]|nr:ABC transporter permease [Bryobacteraceae bacterium]
MSRRMMPFLESVLADLRHAVRLIRRDTGVSALIVLVLALGIGGNAAIFSLLKAAFLDPLPYRDAGRLVTVMENFGNWVPSTSEFLQIRARTKTLEQLAFAEYKDMQVSGAGEPVRVYAARVSASFFPLLGVSASLGRTLLDEENQPGRALAVVLTEAFWRSRMGADPKVVGRTLRLDGQPAQVAGVLPRNFQFDYPTLQISEPVDIYVSYPIEPNVPLHPSGSGMGIAVRVIGRLRAGITVGQAAAELRGIGRTLVGEHPEAFGSRPGSPSPFTFDTLPLRDAIVGTQRSLLWLLLAGVGVLLLIACANTAQLLLARSLRRGREIAIRAALGARRPRLIRQFLLEGLVLAACGGAAGLLASVWMVRVLVAALPVRSPLLASAHLDWRVAGFTTAAALLSGLLFAIIPAVKGSLWTLGPSLGARVSGGEGNRWRYVMIAVEAALSVFLLCGAGLVAQNLWVLISTPVGFDPNHVLAMQIKLPASQQNMPDEQAKIMFQQYLKNVAAIPGVESAATVTGPPLRPARGGPFQITGQTDSSGALKTVLALSSQISPDFFRALRIPLLAGRAFGDNDGGRKITVAIVNEEFAHRFGLDRDVVGKQIADPAVPVTIVGMVGNVRARSLNTAATPEAYFSSQQFSWGNAYLVVRSAIPAGQLVRQVRAAVQSINPDQAVFGVTTMQDLISDAASQPRFDAWLIGVFAFLAVAMAAAGMYSVITCLVSQRTSEIAIRIALGASRGAIARTILGATSAWVAAGLACGLALGFAARSTVRSLSSAAVEGSPWVYAAVAAFFLVVTLAAAGVPTLRASRMDPAATLRCD